MSKYRRWYQKGGHYFFTVVTHNRRPILTENIELLRESFRYAKQKTPFEMDAVVILPDHLHCLWRLPENDDQFSKRWFLIKQYFSRKMKTPLNTRKEKQVWQRRFWEHLIRDENDWQRHMDYIHYNPVKHGLVTTAQDWEYSSLGNCIRKGWYDDGWGQEDPSNFSESGYEYFGGNG